MKILRVQIPEFRALKNVDITFEKNFTPQVFPLCGKNCSGKSTLLRLIHALLQCVKYHPDFIGPLLENYLVPEHMLEQIFATIDVWDGENTVQIEFFLSKNNKNSFYSKYNHCFEGCCYIDSNVQLLYRLTEPLIQWDMIKKISKCTTELSPIPTKSFLTEGESILFENYAFLKGLSEKIFLMVSFDEVSPIDRERKYPYYCS